MISEASDAKRPERTWRHLIVTLCFISIILIGGTCLAAGFGFYGVAFVGLNADAGKVKRGEEFSQTITAINFTLSPAKIILVPTCGCATDQISTHLIGPLSSIKTPISYVIDDKRLGHKERDMFMVYESFGVRRKVTGKVKFILIQ